MAIVRLTGERNEMTSSVNSFLANLPELLGSLLADPRRVVVIVEFTDHRYVQYWLDSPSHFNVEVISNLNIGDAVALSEIDEQSLRSLGWSEPSAPERPNWFRIGESIAVLVEVVRLTHETVRGVLDKAPGNKVRVRTFEVQRRIGSPENNCANTTRVYQLNQAAG